MRFFGRDVSYSYEAAVEELLDGGVGDRAMGINLVADHRVSSARAEVFDRLVARPVSAQTLRDGVVDYFEEKVRVRKLPDFVYRALNQDNILAGRALGDYIVPLDRGWQPVPPSRSTPVGSASEAAPKSPSAAQEGLRRATCVSMDAPGSLNVEC